MRYSCNLRGECEYDEEGGSFTTPNCDGRCRSNDLPLDLIYHTLSFREPGDLVQLAPSDRVEVIHQLTGVIVPTADSSEVLRALADNDLVTLARYPSLYPWLEQNAYPADWNEALQEVAEVLPAAEEELQRLAVS